MDLKKILHAADAADAELNRKIDENIANLQSLNQTLTPVKLKTTDIISFASGFTVSGSAVYKYGNIYTGWIYITGKFAANSTKTIGTGVITPPTTGHLYIGTCGLTTEEWKVTNLGYLFIGSKGNNCIITNPGSTACSGAYITFSFVGN